MYNLENRDKRDRIRSTIGFWSIFILTIIILSCLIFLPNTSAAPAELPKGPIEVKKDGTGDFIKIQDAIDNASIGDTILIYPGEYYEVINITKSLNIIGMGQDNVILRGEGVQSIIVVYTDECYVSNLTAIGTNTGIGLFMWGNNSEVRNCRFEGNVVGVYLHEANYNYFENIVCESNKAVGLYLGNSNYNTFVNTRSLNTSNGTGIYFFYSYKNVLQSGSANGNFGDGIYMYWLADDNRIENFSCNNNGKIGLYLLGTGDFIIKNCVAKYNGDNGFNICSSRNIVENCTSLSNSGDGFYFYHSEGTKLSNCISGLNEGKGLYFKYSEKNIVKNCLLLSNQEQGIKFGLYSKDNIVYNNDFINNNDGYHQAMDNGTGNIYYSESEALGNYWWDYSYFYPEAANNGIVWTTAYELSGANNSIDKYPLIRPWSIGTDTNNIIETFSPGVFQDSDQDGVYDIVDVFPNDPNKFKFKGFPIEIGPIMDENGKLIEDASVSIQIDEVIIVTNTDSKGVTKIPINNSNNIPGIFEVSITKDGYSDLSFKIKIKPNGEINEINIPFFEQVIEDIPEDKDENGDEKKDIVIGLDNIALTTVVFIIILILILLIYPQDKRTKGKNDVVKEKEDQEKKENQDNEKTKHNNHTKHNNAKKGNKNNKNKK
jgi:parallel beta-helix repeat protein